MIDVPEGSGNYTFQFASNIPCPDAPTVDYGGQTYNTIQVFSQCWFKENLNVGEMIDGSLSQANNSVIEKYCYSNSEDSCAKYGGLYQWNEMMQYTAKEGAQGICPPGWHLPTDEEWKVLEGAADSQYGIGDPEWNLYWENRGYDAGSNLKAASGWHNSGNGNDLLGFSILPAGVNGNNFYNIEKFGFIWTSSWPAMNSNPYYRSVVFANPLISRLANYGSGNGFSVRCIKD
jgi:uncharacterized protein (TIGR02145 family)